MTLVADILIGAGLVFIAVSTLALLIMPDLYTRAHAVAKSETLGLLLVFIGLFLRPEMQSSSYGRLAFVIIFSLIANPTAVHALVRAAARSGALPWTVVDHRIAGEELDGEHDAVAPGARSPEPDAGTSQGGSAYPGGRSTEEGPR